MKYNITTGIKRARSKARKILIGMTAMVFPAALLFQGFASATPSTPAYPFTLVPFEYVGAADACGTGSPAGNPDMVEAKWVKTTGNPKPAIKLQKLGLTSNCIAAGVDIVTPLENGPLSALTELNFDFKDGWHCGAGAPRFNIQTEVTTTTVQALGCNTVLGTDTPSSTPGWTHVEFSAADIAAAVALWAPGSTTLKDLYIIFDEGSDTGPDFTGTAFIDNISVNNKVVGSPSVPRNKGDCKNGGWENVTDNKGNTFDNERDCLNYVNDQKDKDDDDHHHNRRNNDRYKHSEKEWSEHRHNR